MEDAAECPKWGIYKSVSRKKGIASTALQERVKGETAKPLRLGGKLISTGEQELEITDHKLANMLYGLTPIDQQLNSPKRTI